MMCERHTRHPNQTLLDRNIISKVSDLNETRCGLNQPTTASQHRVGVHAKRDAMCLWKQLVQYRKTLASHTRRPEAHVLTALGQPVHQGLRLDYGPPRMLHLLPCCALHTPAAC